MFDKMKQMMELQKQAKALQKSLEATMIEKTSKDGKVRLVMNGRNQVQEIAIDDSLLSPAFKKQIEQTLSKLVTEACDEIQRKNASQAMELMKGLGG